MNRGAAAVVSGSVFPNRDISSVNNPFDTKTVENDLTNIVFAKDHNSYF